MNGKKLPDVTFKTRVRDESVGGPNPYRWEDKTTADYFAGMFGDFQAQGIDEIYCIAVNDAFVMNAWGKSQELKNVKLIPDGTGEFTRKMGMLVCKDNLGFGMRSWRYAAVVDDGVVESWFEEPGFADNCETDPYGECAPQNVLDKLVQKVAA